MQSIFTRDALLSPHFNDQSYLQVLLRTGTFRDESEQQRVEACIAHVHQQRHDVLAQHVAEGTPDTEITHAVEQKFVLAKQSALALRKAEERLRVMLDGVYQQIQSNLVASENATRAMVALRDVSRFVGLMKKLSTLFTTDAEEAEAEEEKKKQKPAESVAGNDSRPPGRTTTTTTPPPRTTTTSPVPAGTSGRSAKGAAPTVDVPPSGLRDVSHPSSTTTTSSHVPVTGGGSSSGGGGGGLSLCPTSWSHLPHAALVLREVHDLLHSTDLYGLDVVEAHLPALQEWSTTLKRGISQLLQLPESSAIEEEEMGGGWSLASSSPGVGGPPHPTTTGGVADPSARLGLHPPPIPMRLPIDSHPRGAAPPLLRHTKMDLAVTAAYLYGTLPSTAVQLMQDHKRAMLRIISRQLSLQTMVDTYRQHHPSPSSSSAAAVSTAATTMEPVVGLSPLGQVMLTQLTSTLGVVWAHTRHVIRFWHTILRHRDPVTGQPYLHALLQGKSSSSSFPRSSDIASSSSSSGGAPQTGSSIDPSSLVAEYMIDVLDTVKAAMADMQAQPSWLASAWGPAPASPSPTTNLVEKDGKTGRPSLSSSSSFAAASNSPPLLPTSVMYDRYTRLLLQFLGVGSLPGAAGGGIDHRRPRLAPPPPPSFSIATSSSAAAAPSSLPPNMLPTGREGDRGLVEVVELLFALDREMASLPTSSSFPSSVSGGDRGAEDGAREAMAAWEEHFFDGWMADMTRPVRAFWFPLWVEGQARWWRPVQQIWGTLVRGAEHFPQYPVSAMGQHMPTPTPTPTLSSSSSSPPNEGDGTRQECLWATPHVWLTQDIEEGYMHRVKTTWHAFCTGKWGEGGGAGAERWGGRGGGRCSPSSSSSMSVLPDIGSMHIFLLGVLQVLLRWEKTVAVTSRRLPLPPQPSVMGPMTVLQLLHVAMANGCAVIAEGLREMGHDLQRCLLPRGEEGGGGVGGGVVERWVRPTSAPRRTAGVEGGGGGGGRKKKMSSAAVEAMVGRFCAPLLLAQDENGSEDGDDQDGRGGGGDFSGGHDGRTHPTAHPTKGGEAEDAAQRRRQRRRRERKFLLRCPLEETTTEAHDDDSNEESEEAEWDERSPTGREGEEVWRVGRLRGLLRQRPIDVVTALSGCPLDIQLQWEEMECRRLARRLQQWHRLLVYPFMESVVEVVCEYFPRCLAEEMTMAMAEAKREEDGTLQGHASDHLSPLPPSPHLLPPPPRLSSVSSSSSTTPAGERGKRSRAILPQLQRLTEHFRQSYYVHFFHRHAAWVDASRQVMDVLLSRLLVEALVAARPLSSSEGKQRTFTLASFGTPTLPPAASSSSSVGDVLTAGQRGLQHLLETLPTVLPTVVDHLRSGGVPRPTLWLFGLAKQLSGLYGTLAQAGIRWLQPASTMVNMEGEVEATSPSSTVTAAEVVMPFFQRLPPQWARLVLLQQLVWEMSALPTEDEAERKDETGEEVPVRRPQFPPLQWPTCLLPHSIGTASRETDPHGPEKGKESGRGWRWSTLDGLRQAMAYEVFWDSRERRGGRWMGTAAEEEEVEQESMRSPSTSWEAPLPPPSPPLSHSTERRAGEDGGEGRVAADAITRVDDAPLRQGMEENNDDGNVIPTTTAAVPSSLHSSPSSALTPTGEALQWAMGSVLRAVGGYVPAEALFRTVWGSIEGM